MASSTCPIVLAQDGENIIDLAADAKAIIEPVFVEPIDETDITDPALLLGERW